jgi:hypothetical protein
MVEMVVLITLSGLLVLAVVVVALPKRTTFHWVLQQRHTPFHLLRPGSRHQLRCAPRLVLTGSKDRQQVALVGKEHMAIQSLMVEQEE